MSWLDTINTIEDLPTGQLRPGTFYWLHGVNKGGAKTPGVFYVKAAEVGDVPPAPWAEDTRFDGETGYAAPALRLSFIGWRSQWYMQEEQGKPKLWIPGYEKGAKKHTDFLCFAEGIEAPMILSADGMNKERPLSDILKSYRNGLLTQASRIAKRALPLWTFWLPIKNKLTADGKTHYIEATDGSGKGYGSFVTPPTLYLPNDAMESCFVGEDILRKGADVAREYREWFDERRRGPDVIEGEVLPALPAPKNVPQPVSAAELGHGVEVVDLPDTALPF